MFELTFQFENDEKPVVISVSPEESVLDAARKANVAIDAPCSGNGSCGKCRVKLVSGELTGPQTAHISDEEYADGWRLSCCMHAASDAVVLVPDIASAYRSRMKTADLSSGEEIRIFEELLAGVQGAGISLGNGFRAVDLQLDEPTLDDTMPDNERLTRALEAQDGIDSVRLPWYAMRRLPKALRDNAFAVRVLGELQNGIFTVFDVTGQNDTLPLCGVGIDIGTTTVSAVLFDMKDGRLLSKASGGNGQIRYGADVINRIIEQGKPGGRKKLQDAILKETLVPLLQTLCKDAKLPPARIVRLCVASNTTMNHLFVGVDADPVRMEPYIPAFFHWDGLRVHDLGLPAHPDAAIRLAPNIGSYVGGDITAGTFASMLWDRDELSLFIDLGTNGEIVFGNRDFMVSCACSAFLLALLFMAGRDFGLTWRFRTLTDHDITWGQALRVNMLCEFTSAVTPSTVGGSSFGMIYLTGEGLNFGRSTAIMITTLFLDELFYVVACPIALALIGWSGLFDISNAHISSTIRLTFWFVYGGLSLWALILGLGIFVRPSAIRSLLINACRLPLLRRWKKEAAEMGDAIVATSGELRQKSFWWWLRAFFGTALSWISRYMVVNAILLAFAINADQVMVLARQLVMWVVLTICPTPGGSGVSEWIFKNYYGDMIASGSLALLLALCWRIISYYIYLIIGICVIPSWLRQWKRKRQKAKSNGINGQETMQHPR